MYLIDFNYAPNAVQKMGCDIDEVISSSLNISRKNYIDFFDYKPEGEQYKIVGNSLKSKRLQTFIETFMSKSFGLLIQNRGHDFIEEYYKYIEKIYNYQIPLRDIASKGKIKKSLEEYKNDVKTITKAGRPKSRQAWYELAIEHNLPVNNGDTIYYINTGTSKSHSDIKKITHYFFINTDGEKVEFTKTIDRDYKKYKKDCNNAGCVEKTKGQWIKYAYPNFFTEDEIIKNCMLVPQSIIDSETDVFCDEDNNIEYNVAKYIDMFNKRITPLLVCFDRSIRDKILITNPDDRKFFTEDECKMSSGQPNKPGDQDTYEALMTMEDKEIRFWTKYNLVPPFIEECGMGKWEDIVSDYNNRMEEEKKLGVDIERNFYNNAINELTKEDICAFEEEGTIPSKLLDVVELDPLSCNFVSKRYKDIKIGSIYDIIDKQFEEEKEIDDSVLDAA